MDEPAKRPGQSAIPPSKASGPPARRKYAIALRWGAAIALGIGILLYLTYSEMRAKRKLALIRGALQDYASSIKSLEGRYEIESGWNARDPDQLRSTGERPNSHSKSTAAFGVDFASKRWFRDYIRAEGEGTDPELWLRRRELAVFDGSLGSTLHYLPAYPGEEADDWPPPNFLMIDSGSHEMATPPWIFAGIKTNFVGGGLVRILETAAGEGKIKYKGTERIDGALCECVTIELPPDHVARFWFDPERDYLPRR
ncbi:MAG TPA: hypothetical protein VKU82_14495, partial [Planctomycetaceae bacterium]|nr:hypothetical protein [Planctomycetaceae bacterium]